MAEMWGLCDKDGNPTTKTVQRFQKYLKAIIIK